jgi:DNA-binding response OmpR family regulator
MVRALVVVADTATAELLIDIVASAEHEWDLADSQCAARKLLDANRYAYVLLELNIAARSGCSVLRPQTGLNLLEQIRSCPKTHALPVIATLLTAPLTSAVAAEVAKLGAKALFDPPLICACRTIDQAIRSIVRRRGDVGSRESLMLTVKQAGQKLIDVVDDLTLKHAMARVSKAADNGRFQTNGQRGATRRICCDSFSAWLLEQRSRWLQEAG